MTNLSSLFLSLSLGTLVFLFSSQAMAQDADTAALPLVVLPDSALHDPLPFQPGELLEYKVTFGMFAVAKAQIRTFSSLYKINKRDCFRVEVRGKTSGAVDWVARVDDTWGSYFDSLSLYPLMSYRNIKESNYRKNEITRFDYANSMIELKTKNQKTGKMNEPKLFQFPEPVYDLISGCQFLRAQSYSEIATGDTLKVKGVFEDEFYEMEILYEGTEAVKTKLGFLECHRLVPIMPDNKLFDGENAITLWLSADENRIPVLIDANMFIGNASCELIGHKNLKAPLQIHSSKRL